MRVFQSIEGIQNVTLGWCLLANIKKILLELFMVVYEEITYKLKESYVCES